MVIYDSTSQNGRRFLPSAFEEYQDMPYTEEDTEEEEN